MTKRLILVITLALLVCGQPSRLTTASADDTITLQGNGHLARLDTKTGKITHIDTPLDTFSDYSKGESQDYSLSPLKKSLVIWKTKPNFFGNGIWLMRLDNPQKMQQLPIDVNPARIDYVEAHWLLGEQYAILQTGIVTGGDPQYPNPFWMIDTSVWLIDSEKGTLLPWNFNCNTLVWLEKANEFAVYCPNTPFRVVATQAFLTAKGWTNDVGEPYQVLYTKTTRNELGWVFSPKMDQVAVINHHLSPDLPARDEVLIYHNNGDSQWLVTFDGFTPVHDVAWSPSGRYLAIAVSCQNAAMSDCEEVWDTQTRKIVWDASRLCDISDGHCSLYATSVYWQNDGHEFFLLGRFSGKNSGTYVWNIALMAEAPLAQWSVPSSMFDIVSAGNSESSQAPF